jgi:hypothetical protein
LAKRHVSLVTTRTLLADVRVLASKIVPVAVIFSLSKENASNRYCDPRLFSNVRCERPVKGPEHWDPAIYAMSPAARRCLVVSRI